MKVFLTGATGFVGRHMLNRLLQEGHFVRALASDPSAMSGIQHGRLEVVPGDTVEGKGLAEGMNGCTAVIHLVGVIAEVGSATYERVHSQGTRNVVEEAKKQSISRFVQMSALGARADGVSGYQTTKWKAEEAVRHSGIPYCILRPSLIFGAGAAGMNGGPGGPAEGFVSQMLDVMRKAPLVRPVPGDGLPKFRPVNVSDVAMCFVRALTCEAATGRTIELGGAEELTLNEILSLVARCAGVGKPAFHVPMPIMLAIAIIAQALSKQPPVTVGQLRMLKEGSTCDIRSMMETFDITPVGFREGLPKYLRAAASV